MESDNTHDSMKSVFISTSSFVIFIAGLYYLLNFQLIYAVGFGVLLLIHELGHVFALNKMEGTIKGVYFFPFVGAIVTSDKKLKTENEYAYVKYMGPLVGTLGVLATLFIFFLLDDQRFLHLVFVGAILNLINMVPITFLDGYGVLRGSIKNVEWLGFLIVVIIGAFIFHQYIFTLLLLVIFTLFSEVPNKEGTGFQVHEVVLTSIFILAMIILSWADKDNLVLNIPLVALSVYVFVAYIRTTKFNPQKVPVILKLTPLTSREKVLWPVRWVALSLFLIVTAVYSAPPM